MAKRLVFNFFLILFLTTLFQTKNLQAQTCQENYANIVRWVANLCVESAAACEDGCAETHCTCPNYHPEIIATAVGMAAICYANQEVVNGDSLDQCGTASTIPSQPSNNISQPANVCGSVIQVENQVVGEIVPIVGAHFSMTYFSNRVTGRVGDYSIHLPLTNGTLVTDIDSFDVLMKDINNSTIYSHNYSNSTTNINYDYTWDGLDSFSNPTIGATQVKVFVTQNWVAIGTYSAFSIGPMERDFFIGSFKAKLIGLGAWVPSIYHFYDPISHKLYNGNGTTRNIAATSDGSGGFIVAEEDASLVYYFNSSGKQTSTKTGLIGTTIYTFNYDGSGRLSSIDEPFSQTITFHRDMSGNLTSIEAPRGQSTDVTLDGNGYIETFTNPNSEVYTMSYVDAGGLLDTFEKPNGMVSTFTYDAFGNLEEDSHASGYSQTLAPQSTPGQIYKTTAMGRVTQYATSINGNSYSRSIALPSNGSGSETSDYYNTNTLFSSTTNGITQSLNLYPDPRFGDQSRYPVISSIGYYPVARETDTTYTVNLSSGSDPFSVTDSTRVDTTGNLVVTTTYDGSTKVFSSATNVGRAASVGIDTYERPITSQKGNLYSVDYTYSSEQLTDIDQNTRNTHFTYNGDGTLASVTNSLSKTTSFGYDDAGRVNLVTLPDSRTVAYTYDNDGNLASVTPPSSSTHNLGFNSEDLFETYDLPILGMNPQKTLSYTYNDDNQLTQIEKPSTDTIDFGYNNTTGVLETITTPDGVFNYTTYSSNGLPYTIASPSYVWNETIYYAGIIPNSVQTVGPDAGSNFTFAKTLQTNALVQNDTVTANSGSSQIDYTYDDDEYLETAGDLALTFDTPNGLLSDTTLGNITDAYTYNDYGEATYYEAKVNGSTVYALTLGRDAGGRVYTKSENLNGTTKNYGYSFDDAGRLHITTLGGSTVATYNYSNNSNRTSGTIYSTSLSATYNAQDSLTAYNNYDYAYNDNGDLTSKTNSLTSAVTSYVYDVFGNLTQVTLPSTTVIDYETDPLNRRVGKKVGGTVQKRWVYMDQTRIAAELDSSGNITKRFVYGSKSNIPDYMIDDNGEKYRIISDQVGSPRLVIKLSNGAITQKMEHDEFGNVLQDTNPGFIPFGFAGGLYDADTGLVRFGARDYDPAVGRWTAKDPILFSGGDSNLYGYVLLDPVNWIDSNGMFAVQIGSGGSAAVIVGGQEETGYAFAIDNSSGTVSSGSYGSGGFSYGANIGAGLGASLTVSPFANSVNNLNGQSNGIQINLGALGLGLSWGSDGPSFTGSYGPKESYGISLISNQTKVNNCGK